MSESGWSMTITHEGAMVTTVKTKKALHQMESVTPTMSKDGRRSKST